ncbi:MAG: alpha/beta fold hydrolase [Candidatus Pacebacteria bacterium]|nr:alpha/beta fold hydrolase [Candidatus Paceibacterota bacterium]
MKEFFSNKKLLLIFSFLFFISAFFTYNFFSNQNSLPLAEKALFLTTNSSEQINSEVEKIIADYGEFADLTIPFIKEIKLDNKQLVIEETLAKKGKYTEYRASYYSEGNKIYGLLTIPNEAKMASTPAVIFVHGYIPPKIYKTMKRYVDYVDYLASNGLVVFKIDLRGHDQSEGEARGAYFSNSYVVDVLNAVESIKTISEVDRQQISLWGHSMAGNVVTRAVAVNPEIKSVVIWAGAVYTYSDMADYGINDSSFSRADLPPEHRPRRENLFAKVGNLDSGNDFWKLVSPVDWLKNYSGEIQLHHAIDDQTVSIEYSRNLVNVLKDSAINIKLFEYQSGGHDLEGSSFNQAMNHSVEVFTR